MANLCNHRLPHIVRRTHRKWAHGSIPLFVTCLWSLLALARTQSGGVSLTQDCERTLSDGTIEYLACSASSEALSQLDVSVSVDPVNSTCGYSTDQNRMLYSTLGFNIYSICDAYNDTFAHPPALIVDDHDEENPTWWQSISWYDYPLPLEVNVTFSLDHTYTLVDNLGITFQSGRPQQMILEKSNDGGVSWDIMQYYSSDCARDFSIEDTSEDNIKAASDVICTSDYSGTLPYSDGEVVYNVRDRLAILFSDTRQPEDQVEAYQNDTAFQDLLTLTDLRLRLLYPATDGVEILGQFLSLIKYYYAISNIESYLTCNCNLHGRYCVPGTEGGVVCECLHNTMGASCEQCLPLYNNRPWRAGSFTPYPSGTANECQKCMCNDHADSCSYNSTLGYGVCLECYDNTAGHFCDICVDGFYRNESLEISDAAVCIGCNCEPLGTVDNSSVCSQFANNETGSPIGQCACRENVTGRACDQCVDGYFGLLLQPDPGKCRVCGCNVLGTVNASVSCDQTTGQCFCKANTDTQSCGECKDQYYGFPANASQDCSACGCDPGGSTSLTCNKVTGRCDCRGFIGGQQCQDVQAGYYYPYLDYNGYDAWDANSSCTQQSDFPAENFTGRGYQLCALGNVVTFTGVKAFSNSQEMLNFVSLRYSYDSQSEWTMVAMTITVEGMNSTAFPCPYSSGSVISSDGFSLQPGKSAAWTSSGSVSFHPGCSYSVRVELDSPGLGADSILIDALVLLPNPTLFTVYGIADSEQRQLYDGCITNLSSLATRPTALGTCQAMTFSVMLELFGEAQECECDSMGSLQTMCSPYGGGCLCKSGVGGQCCDQCLPGYFNFTSNGCQACDCNAEGSTTLACDYVTGQCPCQSGVADAGQTIALGLPSDRQCSACRENFYGFGSADGCTACECSQLGSMLLQCNEDGSCDCLDTIGGEKCDSCLDGFFNLTTMGCSPCECDMEGSTSSDCNPTSGVCSCKTNVQGSKCDQCTTGFFNLEATNPNGCQPCFCYGHGQTCNAAPNYVRDSINSDFTKGGTDGWTLSDPSSLDVNPTNIRVSHPPALVDGASVYLLAPQEYLGFQLGSYGGALTFQAKLDFGSVGTLNDRYLIVTGGPQNTEIYYAGDLFILTTEVQSFNATFYEGLWLEVQRGAVVSVEEFQEILADVTSIQVRASFGGGTVSSFYSVAMETASYSSNPSERDEVVTSVEQCVCNTSTNTQGLSCDSCIQGTKRQTPNGPQTDVCVPCFCNGRSASCDPDSGVCMDCRLGTVGDFCESCAANVLEPACGQCIPDYYGFGTDLFDGACSACNCNTTGTGGVTQCDNDSGQCPCVGNYGGQLCDGCAYNFYNYDTGCLKCDVCYDGIETAHLSLLTLTRNLSDYVDFLEVSDNASMPAPFYERLQNTSTHITQLVEATSAAVQEGIDLESTITELNGVTESLLATLEGTISYQLNSAQANATSAAENARLASETVDNINAQLMLAYEELTSGDFQAAQSDLEQARNMLILHASQLDTVRRDAADQVLSLEQEVEGIRNLTQDAVQVANDALQTAQRAQVIHDNTTTRTAAEIGEAINARDLGEQTLAEVNGALGRAAEVDSSARQGVADVQAASTAINESRISDVVQKAGEQTSEAEAVQELAASQLASAGSTINVVEIAHSQTKDLLQEVNVTLSEVDGRWERSAAANQEAADAVRLSEDTFSAAQETLLISLNFENRAADAQAEALAALDDVSSINQEAEGNLAVTEQLRAQLSPVTGAARDGLTLATDAYEIAQVERQDVKPIYDRAQEVYSEAANQLTDTQDIIDAINNLDSTGIQPSLEVCNMYQPDIDQLEVSVTDSTAAAGSAETEVTSSQSKVVDLMAILADISQVDTSGLADLSTRINQARAAFTEDDLVSAISTLQSSVDEQEQWLARTRADIVELSAQIDGLESFGVDGQ